MKRFRKIGLLAAAWIMSLASAGAVGENEIPDALMVHLYSSDAVQTTRRDDLRRTGFPGNGLLLQMQNAKPGSYALDDVRKITFGQAGSNGFAPLAMDWDIWVYVMPQGEVAVETSHTVRSLKIIKK